jgi:hypothetical protein
VILKYTIGPLEPELSLSLIKHTCQSAHLVYHLIAPYDPERLRKWLQAPSDTFRNAMEMFIVTFSRLGFSEPPDWLDQSSQQMLEQSQGEPSHLLPSDDAETMFKVSHRRFLKQS